LPEITPKKNFSWEVEKINFKVRRNCANTSEISSSVSFHQYFQMFDMNFKICFRHVVLLEMISLRRYLEQSHRSFQYNVNNLGTKFLSAFYSNLGGVFLNVSFTLTD